MKILGLSCSPRRQGNTEILIDEALKGAQLEGAEVELYSVSGKSIEPCDGCRACNDTGECHIKDDMQDIYNKIVEADGIIFGAPIYMYTMSAQAKAILDRTIALNRPEKSMANKVGAAVVVGGSLGAVDVLKDLYFYMVTRQMLPANYVAAYASNKGDVRKRELGMKAALNLGRQMAQLAAKNFKYPSGIERARHAYGTHTH